MIKVRKKEPPNRNEETAKIQKQVNMCSNGASKSSCTSRHMIQLKLQSKGHSLIDSTRENQSDFNILLNKLLCMLLEDYEYSNKDSRTLFF